MMNFQDEDEELEGGSTESLSPDQRESVYEALRQKYSDASNDDDVKKADRRARAQEIVGGIGQTLTDANNNYMNVKAGLLGMGPIANSSADHFRQLQAGSKQRAANARQDRKERMDQVLTEDKLDWQGKERGRKEGEWAREDATRGREDDPNSMESKTAQALAKKLMPSQSFDGMSSTQLRGSLPSLEKMYAAEQQRLGRIDSINAAAAARADNAAARQAAKDADHEWKEEQTKKGNDEKRKATLQEVEDRRTNITQNLDLIDKMIEEDGTFELFGSHNQDLDRLVDAVATDMAKLQDPSSVARPSEVDAVKRNLVQAGFGNKNSTARDVIANFKKEVENRADSAYNVRGMADLNPRRKTENIAGDAGKKPGIGEAGAAPAPTPPKVGDTKVIGGVTYKRTDKGWEGQ